MISHISDAHIACITLGCAKNEVDTAHMQQRLRACGFSLTDDPENADAIIINTCSFIQSATEESLEAIFEAAGYENVNAGAPLIVTGCMPARYGDDLAQELTEACAFVPCSKEDDIAEVIAHALGVPLATKEEKPQDEFELMSPGVFAYVKISDGCDRFCSYCTIPFIRGRYHSFTYEAISEEVSQLVKQGVKEIVLIAQDTGRWGSDFEQPLSLAWLVNKLAEAFPRTWFRVMYIQPEGITDELLEVVEQHSNVCSYFDIPLQHVEPALLKAMNRRGSYEDFIELINHIKDRVSNVVLRTTLIAGFPGETEEQFENLCSFVEEGYFDYVGVFAYSREEGTKAYNLPDQIEEDEKNYRAQTLRDIADNVCALKVAERIGKTFEVLIEGSEDDGQLYGRAQCQAPEVDGVTYVDNGIPGEIISVTIEDTLLYEMEGA